MPEAATPTGGAEGSARPAPAQAQAQTPAPSDKPASIQDRIKASLYTAEPAPDEGRALPTETKAQVIPGNGEAIDEPGPDTTGENLGTEDPDAQGAQDETPTNFTSLTELAEALGWESDKVLDLETSTKINGKEGKVRLRDLVKSYQLEGHLNQGLIKLAEERKGFEGETARKAGEIKGRVEQLNKVVTLAQKMLDGEFADVNWPELQRTDPLAFQAKYGAYKMRQDGIQQLHQQVEQEQELAKAQQQAEYKSYLEEQGKLLDTKVPEWSDKGKREKDVAEMATILSESYGITEQELRACVDHRQILLARDAMRWQKLQKSKPATLNKVRAAPKLIRPGTQQSRTTNDAQIQKDRGQLRRTGKVQDATPVLKKLLFN